MFGRSMTAKRRRPRHDRPATAAAAAAAVAWRSNGVHFGWKVAARLVHLQPRFFSPAAAARREQPLTNTNDCWAVGGGGGLQRQTSQPRHEMNSSS